MKRKIIIIVSGLLIIAGSVFAMQFLSEQKKLPDKQKPKAKKISVRVKKVKLQETPIELRGSGRLESRQYVDLISEVQGKIHQGNTLLKKGQSFKKGMLLVRIDQSEFRYALKAKKSKFLNSIANILPDFKIDYTESYPHWMQFFNAIEIEKEMPELPDIQTNKEKIFLASRNILSDYYAIKSDEVRLNKYLLHAPFHGAITEVFLEVGAVANPGSRIAKLIRTDHLELEVPLEANDIEYIKISDTVQVTNENETHSWTGEIIRIANFVEAKTQSVSVFVSITSTQNNLLYKGMYLKAKFPGQPMKQVMEIPRNAVFNSNEVFIVENGRLQKRRIKIHKVNTETLIFSGLKEGTKLVIEPLINANENMPVKAIVKE